MKFFYFFFTLFFLTVTVHDLSAQKDLQSNVGDLDTSLVNDNSYGFKFLESDPDLYPRLNFSNLIGLSGTPHFYAHVTANFDGYFRITDRLQSDVKYSFLFRPWKYYYMDEFGGNYDGLKTFSSLEMTCSYRIFRKYVEANIKIFHSQEVDFVHDIKYLNYIKTPSSYMHYIALSGGYLYYNDILTAFENEPLHVYSADNTYFEHEKINSMNHIVNMGLIFGWDSYVIAQMENRKLRHIVSHRLYVNVLYSPGARIRDIIDHETGNVYPVEMDNSGLDERHIGFKIEFVKSNGISNKLAMDYRFLIGRYPGVIGHPDVLGNFFFGAGIGYSLHFIKNI